MVLLKAEKRQKYFLPHADLYKYYLVCVIVVKYTHTEDLSQASSLLRFWTRCQKDRSLQDLQASV